MLVTSAGLAACGGPVRSGAAAVVGDTRISTETVTSSADQLLQETPDISRDEAVRASAAYRIEYAVVDELAQRQDPPVTAVEGEVTALRNDLVRRAGGPEQLDQAFAQSRVASSDQDAFLRSLLLREKIGAQLVPGDDPTQAEARGAAVQQAAQQLVEDLGIRVNPRFGTWDPQTFSVDPLASGGLAGAAVDPDAAAPVDPDAAPPADPDAAPPADPAE